MAGPVSAGSVPAATVAPAAGERPVVLCIVNRPNWAHDRKTDALDRELAGAYRIVKRYQHEVVESDIAGADCVLLYFWLQVVEGLAHLRPALERARGRLLLGICSHFELEGNWREPGLSLLNELPRAVFVNNRALLSEFGPLLRRPVFYTPNGVDTRFFRPGAETSARAGAPLRVGWAGSLTNHTPEHRGVREFIAPAVAAVPGAELRLAAREEVWRGSSEMLDFYHSLDVYVCASRSEGTPNPCLEAAACGLPVVTTRVGNMPEMVRHGDNGLFVERSVESIAAALTLLRDDPALRARLGAAARATVEGDWDWRVQAANYAAMFGAAIGGEAALAAAR